MELKKLFAEQQWRHKHREQNYGHRERGEGEMYGESNMETHITIYKVNSQWEFAICLRELKQALCINLVGWGGEGDGRKGQEEGTYVYLWLIHSEVWQKATRFYRKIILQLKSK